MNRIHYNLLDGDGIMPVPYRKAFFFCTMTIATLVIGYISNINNDSTTALLCIAFAGSAFISLLVEDFSVALNWEQRI